MFFRDVHDASWRTDVNSIKNLLVVAVLLGVGYAVYTTINSNPGSTPPPGEGDNWPPPVDVRVPGTQDGKSAASKNPFAPGGSKKAERVAAQDAPAFGGTRAASPGPAGTPGRPPRPTVAREPRSLPTADRPLRPVLRPARRPTASARQTLAQSTPSQGSRSRGSRSPRIFLGRAPRRWPMTCGPVPGPSPREPRRTKSARNSSP